MDVQQTGEGGRLAARNICAPLKPKAGLNGPPSALPGPPVPEVEFLDILFPARGILSVHTCSSKHSLAVVVPVIRRNLFLAPLLLLIPISLFSQFRGSLSRSAPPSKLEIQVTSEDSRPLQNTQVYVEVSSFQDGPMRGYTDSNGRVDFYVRSGTDYELTASGPGIVTTSKSFSIPQSERFHQEEIEVRLDTGVAATKGPGGIISASNLRIPQKAREEFAEGMKEMSARNWSKARHHFEKATKDYPQLDSGYNDIGVTYIQENNTNAARKAFEKAVAINDKNPDAVRNLARLKLMDNDFNSGKQLLLKLGPDPRDLDALTMLAYAQLNTNDLDAALANALKVQQGGPDRFPIVHLIAARVYELKGDRTAAQSQYQMYLKAAPDTPQAQSARQGLQRLAASK
jgi:Tfp pilus assembly protein PilF